MRSSWRSVASKSYKNKLWMNHFIEIIFIGRSCYSRPVDVHTTRKAESYCHASGWWLMKEAIQLISYRLLLVFSSFFSLFFFSVLLFWHLNDNFIKNSGWQRIICLPLDPDAIKITFVFIWHPLLLCMKNERSISVQNPWSKVNIDFDCI